MLENKVMEPMTTLLPAAPDELLNTLFCNCKYGVGVEHPGCNASVMVQASLQAVSSQTVRTAMHLPLKL